MAETMLSADELYRVCLTLLRAVGTPDDLAAVVADGLHGANLAGHDSHGVVRLPMYVRVILVLNGGERSAADRGRGTIRLVTKVGLNMLSPLTFATL